MRLSTLISHALLYLLFLLKLKTKTTFTCKKKKYLYINISFFGEVMCFLVAENIKEILYK